MGTNLPKLNWFDESHFLLQHGGGGVWVWHRQQESMGPICLVSTVQVAGGCVTVLRMALVLVFSWHSSLALFECHSLSECIPNAPCHKAHVMCLYVMDILYKASFCLYAVLTHSLPVSRCRCVNVLPCIFSLFPYQTAIAGLHKVALPLLTKFQKQWVIWKVCTLQGCDLGLLLWGWTHISYITTVSCLQQSLL